LFDELRTTLAGSGNATPAAGKGTERVCRFFAPAVTVYMDISLVRLMHEANAIAANEYAVRSRIVLGCRFEIGIRSLFSDFFWKCSW
jgi:hypothetical protein